MKLLEDYISKYADCHDDGVVLAGGFLNHNIDTSLLAKIGEEFAHLFEGRQITKILTVEASGICFAVATAFCMGNIPVLFAKKSAAKNATGEQYCAEVRSYTRGNTSNIMIPSKYLDSHDKVLLIDDFLAHGEALKGLIDIVRQANAHLVGAGIVVEKAFEPGGKLLRQQGVDVKSLAVIQKIVNGTPIFE